MYDCTDDNLVNIYFNTSFIPARILHLLCTGQGDPGLQEAVCGGGLAREVLALVMENIRNFMSS